MAPSSKTSSLPSAATSAWYCFVIAPSGSVRIRMKSASVRGLSSTRIGNLPCNSGMRSLGLDTWNAPAAMKRMWSVRT